MLRDAARCSGRDAFQRSRRLHPGAVVKTGWGPRICGHWRTGVALPHINSRQGCWYVVFVSLLVFAHQSNDRIQYRVLRVRLQVLMARRSQSVFSRFVFFQPAHTSSVINHVPILGVGSRQIKHSELPLLRFGLPPSYEPSTPIARPVLDSEISHPHSPSIRYSVNSPTTPVGPLDLVPIPIHLLPSDPGVSFRSASVIIERRMRFMEPPSPPSTPTLPSSTYPTSSALPSSSNPSCSLPIPQRTSSSSSSLSYSPSSSYQESSYLSSSTTLQPSDSRASTVGASLLVNSVAGSESSGLFARADSGVWSKTLTLQWPAAKSHSRWAIGETIESDLVSVKFFVRVKVCMFLHS